MKVNNLIVGFTGYAKAGKDTAAQAIASVLDQYGVRVERKAFAEPIRLIGDVFGYTWEQMSDQELKETYTGNTITNGMTPRKFMQLVGSEMFRKLIDPDIWVRRMESQFEPDGSSNNGEQLELGFGQNIWVPQNVYLITDVRFPNEAEMIKNHGGFIFKIERTNWVASGEWRKHESEKFIDELNVDGTWYNNAGSAIEWGGDAVHQFGEFVRTNNIQFNV